MPDFADISGTHNNIHSYYRKMLNQDESKKGTF